MVSEVLWMYLRLLFQNKNRLKKFYGFISGIIALIIALVVFGLLQYLPGQKNLYYGDYYEQVYVFTRLFITKLFEGSNLYYSNNIGMGTGTSLLFWFYSFSPVGLLTALIPNAQIATLSAIFIKIMLSAIFFQLFCQICMKKDGIETVIFSVSYALSAFTISVLQIGFMDEIYMLPLLLIVVFLYNSRSNKKEWFLVTIYVIVFLSNFYTGYTVGIVSFFYFLYLLAEKKHSKKVFIKELFKYCLLVGTALLLCACVILPAIYIAMHNSGNINGIFDYVAPTIRNYLLCFFDMQNKNDNQMCPYAFCGILPIILMVLFFMNKDIPKREKMVYGLSLLFLTICVFFSPLYCLMHLLNQPDLYTHRFFYIAVFLILTIAVRQFSYMKKVFDTKTKVSMILLLGLYLILKSLELGFEANIGLTLFKSCVTICFIILFVLLMGVYYKKRWQNIVKFLCLLLVCIEMAMNFYYECDVDIYPVLQSEEKNMYINIKNIRKELPDFDSNSRIFVNMPFSLNQNTRENYLGMMAFCSGLSGNANRELAKMGVASNTFSLFQVSHSPALKMLFSEKYQYNVEDNSIVENTNSLALGYMIKEDIDLSNNDENNPFIYTNHVLKSFSDVAETDYFECYDQGVDVEVSGMEFEPRGSGILVRRMNNYKGSVWIKFCIPEKDQQKAFFYCGKYEQNGSSNVGCAKIRTANHNEDYSSWNSKMNTPHIVEMDHENGECTVTIILPEGDVTEFYIDDLFFAYSDENVLNQYYEDLSANMFNVQCYEDGYLSGTVSVEDDKSLLFLSIPYDEGWSVYVDNKKTKISPCLGDAFMGVELSRGIHELVFRYKTPWALEGLIGTLIGFLCYIIIVVASVKRNRAD